MHADEGKARRGTYRFVHTSDLHLDAPMRGITIPPGPLRAVLRDASLRAWQSLVELAIDRAAAFVVLAGGLFDSDTPTLRSCIALRDGLQRLRAHAIEVSIALADTDGPRSALLPWLTDATLFANDRIDAVRIVRDGECLAVLHGVSAGKMDAWQAARGLRPLGEGLQIAVLPTKLGAVVGRHARDAASFDELRTRPFDGLRTLPFDMLRPFDEPEMGELVSTGLHYWAIGGSPASAVVHESPWIVHAGTVQGRSLEPSEVGPKGCMVVEVEAGRIGSVTPVELDHVRFLSLRLDVSDCTDASAVRHNLLRELERRVSGDRVTVVDAALSGRLCARGAPDRLAFEAELVADLRRACAMWTAPVWWVGVRDLASREARSGPTGPWDLRRIVTEQSEALRAPLPGSTFLARVFAPLFRQWDAETDLAAQRELVRDAGALALDVLDGEGTP